MELQEIVQDRISQNTKHAHYDRVVKLADKYATFITNPVDNDGEQALSKYLRQFVRREDNQLFEQRKNNTKHYTPSICKQIMRPFNKVLRSNRVISLIDHKTADVVSDIQESLVKFYGESDGNGVDQYLNERFKVLTFTDPNAWIWVTFDNFDANREKPQTFPVDYSSKDVIDFEVKNNITKWVLVQLTYAYPKENKDKGIADRFLMFGENETYEYREIPKDSTEEFKTADVFWMDEKNKKNYHVVPYEHKSERVPLMRVGYVEDIETDSKTYVNPFHYEAMPLLEQFIKVSSELQLSITLHTFPKQISYVEKCTNTGCNDGIMTTGNSVCEICKGTGKQVHTTAADIMEVPMPKRPEDMVDVSKLSAYVPFPGGVMDFLDKYADKMEKKIMRMMFNSESMVQTQFHTATEAEIDVDSVYDTLHPFAEKYSEIWMFMVKLTVLYRAHKDVIVQHRFPTDFKLKPLSQLLTELKTANDSHAPSYIIESINNDIADIIYADDPMERAKLSIKNKHFPFSGKSDFEIQNIIMNNLTTKFNQILYANFDGIMDELESEEPEFFSFAYKRQKEMIAIKVDEIISQLQPAGEFNLN